MLFFILKKSHNFFPQKHMFFVIYDLLNIIKFCRMEYFFSITCEISAWFFVVNCWINYGFEEYAGDASWGRSPLIYWSLGINLSSSFAIRLRWCHLKSPRRPKRYSVIQASSTASRKAWPRYQPIEISQRVLQILFLYNLWHWSAI